MQDLFHLDDIGEEDYTAEVVVSSFKTILTNQKSPKKRFLNVVKP